jgi:hypothetical protein
MAVLYKNHTTKRRIKMETVAEASSIHGATILIMMIMGYAIAFSYLLIALAKKEIGYLRKDNERSLQYFQERVERDLIRLQDENTQLRREVRALNNQGQ